VSAQATAAGAALAGKVAVVTGGGRGMGRAIACAFAEEGADVAIVDRMADHLDEVRGEVEARGRRVLAVEADLTEVGRLPALFDSIASELGGIDVLMNNAGVSPAGDAIDVTEETWDLAMGVNAKALFFCAREAGRHFIEQGKRGKIVNTCSTYGQTVEPGLSVYCASKGAVLQVTRALASEWARHGINVNAIGPTMIATAMTRELFQDEDYIRRFLARIPAGQLPRASDVADAAVFLAGPGSDSVHGHLLLVDSGELTV
jgi:NAD(P)-dependent dehydrogenase (short-subunit alcohol dehydrogenase family)